MTSQGVKAALKLNENQVKQTFTGRSCEEKKSDSQATQRERHDAIAADSLELICQINHLLTSLWGSG